MNRRKYSTKKASNKELCRLAQIKGDVADLRQSEAKYRSFIENLSVMFYAAEPHPPYAPIYVSPAFAQLGYPLEAWRENLEFWTQIMHAEDREWVLEKTEAAMYAGTETDYEYRIIAWDGTIRWVRDRGSFTRDEQGTAVCWQGIILDITDHKRAENALRESEAQFKSAFEDAAVGMAISSLDGRWIEVNERLCEMLGYSRQELTNRRFAEITHPDDIQADLDSKARFIADEYYIHQREKRYVHKNGGIVWVSLNASLVRGANGDPKHFISQMQDITEHKSVVEALRESEQKYRAIFENANDLIYIHDLEGNYLSINKATERVIGYTLEEALKLNISRIVAPEHLEFARQKLAEKLAGAKEQTVYEIECVTKYDQRVTLEINSSLIYKGGEVVAVQGIARDVSERKRAENALLWNETKLKDLFDNAPIGYHELDREGRVVRVNQSELQMLGYESDEMLGHFIWEFVAESVSRDAVLKKLSDKQELVPHERTFLRKDGSRVPVLVNDKLIKDENGRITGIRTAVQNITERKQAEAALIASEQQYRMLSEGIMHQVWTARPDGRLDYANQRALEYFGLSSKKLLGDNWQSVIHPEDLPSCIEKWKHSLATGDDYITDFRLRRHDGEYRWFKARATAGRDTKGNIISWFGTNSDVNERKMAVAKLKYVAGHDTLTNLPNRARFMHHLERAVKRAEIDPSFRFAVLFLDSTLR